MKLFLFSDLEGDFIGGGHAALVVAETEEQAREILARTDGRPRFDDTPVVLTMDSIPNEPGELWIGEYYE